jgi:hypothetical protein
MSGDSASELRHMIDVVIKSLRVLGNDRFESLQCV